jgi:hypothetical protein
MYINQQDAQISVINLYFILDALHVSDYISPSSGATFISYTSRLVYSNTPGCWVTITTQQPGVFEYTRQDKIVQVAPILRR